MKTALEIHLSQSDCKNQSVCAVIVTYNPDLTRIQTLVESVVAQVDFVVIVDNGSTSQTIEFLHKSIDRTGLKLIEFGQNLGIAAAHNAGIRYAMESGYAFVLLLDHDSQLLPGCVENLLNVSQHLVNDGYKVAAVGPQYNDETSGRRAPFLRFYRWTFHKIYSRYADDVIEASVLISSGSLISCQTLAAVGLMDETLFIDGVDWEWCFRASSQGYRLFGVGAAIMQHSLGDSGIHILGRVLPLHNPLRHYYVYRNTVLMCRMRQIPFSWKLHFSIRLLVRFVIYMVLAPRRLERARLILKGLFDGICGRSGRIVRSAVR